MSIEPTCDFCGAADKYRCKRQIEADACKFYNPPKKEQSMTDKTQEKINTIANQSARSSIAVIDALAQRGGFRGEELITIGTLREQCVQLIQLCESLSRTTLESPESE
jgi:hypothetical protein